jgi:hypothetical protein
MHRAAKQWQSMAGHVEAEQQQSIDKRCGAVAQRRRGSVAKQGEKNEEGMTKQQIHDDGDLRKYRIEIPNMADDELDPYQFRLYAHYKRVCGGNGGTCWESVRTTAERTKISTAKIVDTRRELEEGGWIKVSEHKTGTYQIVIVDRWLENFKKYAVSQEDEAERSPDKQPDEGVSQANRVLAPLTERSPGEHPVSDTNRRTNTKKKKQIEEKTKEEQQQLVVADSVLDEFQTIKDLIPAATDAAIEAWLRLYGYAHLRERVDWYLKGVELGKVDGIGWMAKCLNEDYKRPSWLDAPKRQADGPPADYHDYLSGKYGSQIDTGDDFPEPPPDPVPELDPPALSPAPVIVEFTQPLLPARVGTHNLLALVAESMGDLPAVEQPAIRQTSAPKLAVVENAPPNGNGHRRIFEPKKPSEEERERMAQMVEEAQARLVARLGKPTVKRKPGEPDARLGATAPRLAGQKEIA